MNNNHHSSSAENYDAAQAPQQPQEVPQAPQDVPPLAAHASQDAVPTTAASAATTASGDAASTDDSIVAALANDLEYTITVGQTRELFAAHSRKVPAERTVQNYCIEGSIAAQKIRTTYGSEWLINESSLLAFIEQQPIVLAAPQQPQEVPQAPQDVPPLAAHASQNAVPTTAASAATTASGDARNDATPATDAALAVPSAAAHSPVGETRTLGAVLIENAKLLAAIEGKDQVIRGKDETISELKNDREFLREEVREGRQQRKDTKEIASRMLDAMQNIAIAGKLPPAKAQDDNITARFVDPDEPTSPHA